jgi:hypothetical protein
MTTCVPSLIAENAPSLVCGRGGSFDVKASGGIRVKQIIGPLVQDEKDDSKHTGREDRASQGVPKRVSSVVGASSSRTGSPKEGSEKRRPRVRERREGETEAEEREIVAPTGSLKRIDRPDERL